MYALNFRNPAKLVGIAVAAVTAWIVFGTVTALGASPHFIGTPDCTKSLSSGLTCFGKAAGLANEPAIVFLTAASVTATYECKNKGGNIAPGQPVVTQNVTGPTETIEPHNGQVTFSATIPVPPAPSAAVECPNGNWTVVLTSLVYTDVALHIQNSSGVDILTFNFGTIDP
jgi:hypothetical protein